MSRGIHVIGSLMIDRVSRVGTLPRAGETIVAQSSAVFAGGKGANQAAAAARCGARVRMLGRTGRDGAFIVDALRDAGVDVGAVDATDAVAGSATVLVAATGENAIVIAPESNTRIAMTDIAAFLVCAEEGDIVLFQNECSCLVDGIEHAAKRRLRVWLNAAPADASLRSMRLERLAGLVVNETEAEALTGEREPARALEALAARMPAATVIVTLGRAGAIAAVGPERHSHRGFIVEAVDTVGCGDAFVGAYLAAICEGADAKAALMRANAAGALAATRPGAMAALPSRAEINAMVARTEGVPVEGRVGGAVECLACGQLLPSVSLGARCPECGATVVENPFEGAWRSFARRRRLRMGALIVCGSSASMCMGVVVIWAAWYSDVVNSGYFGQIAMGVVAVGVIGWLVGAALMTWQWPTMRGKVALGAMDGLTLLVALALIVVGVSPQLRRLLSGQGAERLVAAALVAKFAFTMILLHPPRPLRLASRMRMLSIASTTGLLLVALFLQRSPSSYPFDARTVVTICFAVGCAGASIAASGLALRLLRLERQGCVEPQKKGVG